MKRILIATVVLAVFLAGCGPSFHLDPRKYCETTVKIEVAEAHLNFRRVAPAPFWVENGWRAALDDVGVKGEVVI